MSWNVGIIKKRLNPDSTILLQDQSNRISLTVIKVNCIIFISKIVCFDSLVDSY